MLAFIGLAIVGVFTYFVYTTARNNGRNGLLWAAINFCIAIVVQWIVPIMCAMVLGIVWASRGADAATIGNRISQTIAVIAIVCMLISLVVPLFILRILMMPPRPQPTKDLGSLEGTA